MMRSPEFPQSLRWFNLSNQAGLSPAAAGSSTLKMRDLGGKHAALLNFWSYSSASCIRVLEYLNAWHEKYAKRGLVVIGVHTPEFEFEKNVENVARAIKEFKIEYPVAMDNDYEAWSLYSNDSRPHLFLVNKDGVVSYNHEGEGAYAETEKAIQAALKEIDPKLEFLPVASDAEGGGHAVVPETYLGAMRGRSGKSWNFKGDWKIFPEYIEHEGKTDNFDDYLSLRFDAAEVNLIMEADGDRPAKVRIELDGKLIKEFDVHEPKMYNLLSGPAGARGELKVFSKDSGFRAYAFSFGGH
jgi:thiol-disulfide isomerase/thioredoxin